MPSPRRLILDLSAAELEALVAGYGEKPFRARQLREWLHAARADSFAAMSNLSKNLRERLEAEFLPRCLAPAEHLVSADKLTEKWLWAAAAELGGGEAESVLIRERRLKRATACVSCMAGCPLGCVFCATGRGGFSRNLSSGEILEQAYRLDAAAEGLTNLVFMGMGEPLLNYDHVLHAARTLADPEGLNLGGRHITISTVGVPEGFRRLAAEGANFRLAVSLHAPSQKLRETLIPAAKRWPLKELLPALHEFAQHASRDLTVEYCLIDGVNSDPAQARELARLLAGLPCKVNLIPLNPVAGFAGRPPPPQAVRAFQEELERRGLPATLRASKGRDIDAACGQLRADRRAGKKE